MCAAGTAKAQLTGSAAHLLDRRIRGNGEVIKREEFDQRKAAAEAARLARLQRKPQKLASQGKDVTGFPLLEVSSWLRLSRPYDKQHDCGGQFTVWGTTAVQHNSGSVVMWDTTQSLRMSRIPVLVQALQEREEAVSNGKLATIIFIRDRNARGQEVSWLSVTSCWCLQHCVVR